MILIAESGATKTDWCLAEKNGRVLKKHTEGIHPFFSAEDNVMALLKDNFDEGIAGECRQVYFYGPGTSNKTASSKLASWLQLHFTQACIEVNTDLLAAGRGAFGNESGMVCILGTGSNSGIYLNNKIAHTLPSLGYIFGDEGSGAHMGKQLLSDYLNGRCPDIVAEHFKAFCGMGVSEIIARVYSGPFPNRFLAGLTPFIREHISLSYCRTLVYNSFDAFFSNRIMQYENYAQYPFRFTGSIAFHFSDILVKTAAARNLNVSPGTDITISPLDGLVQYHLSKL